jgi:hypothetical protein
MWVVGTPRYCKKVLDWHYAGADMTRLGTEPAAQPDREHTGA